MYNHSNVHYIPYIAIATASEMFFAGNFDSCSTLCCIHHHMYEQNQQQSNLVELCEKRGLHFSRCFSCFAFNIAHFFPALHFIGNSFPIFKSICFARQFAFFVCLFGNCLCAARLTDTSH